MINTHWFFLLVTALACAPVLGCLWWVVTSRIRDRRRSRIAERMSATYYHEAVKVPGREDERSRGTSSETTGDRVAVTDGDDRAGHRRESPGDETSDAAGWPAAEPDPVEPEPIRCHPRQVAHHDGPCDCWEDTDVFAAVRDGVPPVSMVPRRPAEPSPAATRPVPPPAAARPVTPPAVPPAAAPSVGPSVGPPPRRPGEWGPPQRPQRRPMPRNAVERNPAEVQRPPAQRPAAERPVPPRRDARPAERPQRPPAQRRERYPADRRDARPARSGKHHLD